MSRYISRALLSTVPTLLILVLLVVILVRLIPGTAVDSMLTQSAASAKDRQQLAHQLGIDRPIPVQYVSYLGSIFDGSLGHSLYDGRPVLGFIRQRAWPTIELAALSLVVSTFIGISTGILSAVKRNSFADYALRVFVNTGLGIPSFVIATAVVLLPAYYFGWAPPLSYVSITANPVKNLLFYVAPVLTLGIGLSSSVARVTRTATLEVIYQDYIRTARAKGLNDRTVILRHVLRNSLLPVMTLIGIQVAFLIGGVVIIEQVFSIPGLGTFLLQKIGERDYPVVQGITLLAGILVISINLIIEILYGFVNPRLRAT